MREVVMNAKHLMSLVFLLLLASGTAYAEWGNIRIVYFAGWNGSDCTRIRASALKDLDVPKDYRDYYAEFSEQVCIKGGKDNKEFRGKKEMAAKEIDYLEKLWIERIPMLKAK
jgi:hypothetical protein